MGMRKRKTDLAYGRQGVTESQRSIESLVRSLFCACERTMRPFGPTPPPRLEVRSKRARSIWCAPIVVVLGTGMRGPIAAIEKSEAGP